MKNLFISICLLASAASVNASVKTIDEFDNSKSYFITRISLTQSGLVYHEAGSDKVMVGNTAIKANEDVALWAIHYSETEKAWFLYNLAAKKFVKGDLDNNAVFTSEAVDFRPCYADKPDSEYWMLDCGGSLLGLPAENYGKAIFVEDYYDATAARKSGIMYRIDDQPSRTVSAAENNEIEQLIRAGKLALADRYREFVAKAEQLAADGLTDYAGSYDLTELKAALAEPDKYSIQQIEDIYKATLLTRLPKHGAYYRLRNFARPVASGMNNVLSVLDANSLRARNIETNAVGVATGSYLEDLALFRVVKKSADPYAVNIEVCALQKSFGTNSNSGKVAMADKDAAYTYTLEPQGDFSRLFALADTGNKRWLTVSGGYDLVGYAWQEDPEKWYFEEVKSIPVKVDANGYAALTLPCAVEIPAGCKAYVVTSVNDGNAYMRELTDAVPEATPFILHSPAKNASVTLQLTDTDAKVAGTMSGNMIKAQLPARHVLVSTPEGVTFSKADAGTVMPNSAYLVSDYDGTLNGVVGEDPAGIEEIDADNIPADRELFDLQGRPVKDPRPGYYIDAVSKKVVIVK